jgi:hypothetical protein
MHSSSPSASAFSRRTASLTALRRLTTCRRRYVPQHSAITVTLGPVVKDERTGHRRKTAEDDLIEEAVQHAEHDAELAEQALLERNRSWTGRLLHDADLAVHQVRNFCCLRRRPPHLRLLILRLANRQGIRSPHSGRVGHGRARHRNGTGINVKHIAIKDEHVSLQLTSYTGIKSAVFQMSFQVSIQSLSLV